MPSISPTREPILSIRGVSKTYAGGFQALKNVTLDIHRGEIFALLGPNGAGKTTLIGTVCGITNPTQGQITADGHDVVRDYRAARALIGLVPQELHPMPSKPSGPPSASAAACSARHRTLPSSSASSRTSRSGTRRTTRS